MVLLILKTMKKRKQSLTTLPNKTKEVQQYSKVQYSIQFIIVQCVIFVLILLNVYLIDNWPICSI